MVVYMTLVFMLYVFIKQSERFVFFLKMIIRVNFCFDDVRRLFLICMCV